MPVRDIEPRHWVYEPSGSADSSLSHLTRKRSILHNSQPSIRLRFFILSNYILVACFIIISVLPSPAPPESTSCPCPPPPPLPLG